MNVLCKLTNHKWEIVYSKKRHKIIECKREDCKYQKDIFDEETPQKYAYRMESV